MDRYDVNPKHWTRILQKGSRDRFCLKIQKKLDKKIEFNT